MFSKTILALIGSLLLATLYYFPKNEKKPIHLVVAMPFNPDVPLDPVSWYTEEYVDYIAKLLPAEDYKVTGYFVSLNNISQFLDDMQKLQEKEGNVRVLNVCDGGESWDGYPGLSVCKLWENHAINGKIPKSGANYAFILNSDDKIQMQKWIKQAHLPALPELLVSSQDALDKEYLLNQLRQSGLEERWPLFCKLNIGAGAKCITDASVCHSLEDLQRQLKEMQTKFPTGNIIVQPYLPGPEYTVLIVGKKVYAALQRDFHNPYNIMLEDYLTDEQNLDNEITYQPAPKHVQEMALKAIQAIPGKQHYTRIDLRDDGKGNVYVIDINERPGFGTPSTVKTMLDFLHLNEADLLREIVETCNP